MAKTETKVIEIRIDLLKGLTDIAELQKRIDALTASNKANDKSTAALKNQYAANSVALKDYRQQLNSLVKESANEIRTTVQKTGYIEKLKAEVSNLTLQYERLNKTELEGAKGTQVLTSLKGKREELAKLNAAYGNHQLNVGNYSSATKMLGINIGQVMKEMPNFAISARIGIMSLTNNLPMLAETIKAVRVEQLAMIEAGQKAPSMFSLISKSIFGLTGIMSIAMVLMQLYGGEIIEWIGTLFKGEKAVEGLTNAQLGLNTVMETYNKTMKDGGGVYGSAISSIQKHKVALDAAKGSSELSKAALDDYNTSLGVTFGKATDVNGALKLIKDNETDYIAAMKNMAFANAFFSQSADDAVKIIERTTAKNFEILGDNSAKYVEAIEKAQKRVTEGASEWVSTWDAAGNKTLQLVPISHDRLLTELRQAEKEYNDATAKERARQIEEIRKNQNISLQQAEKYYNEYADIFEKNKWKVIDTQKEVTATQFDWEQKLREANAKAIKDDEQREIADVKAKYTTKNEEAAKAYAKDASKKKEYDLLIIAYDEEQKRELSDINDKYRNKEIKWMDDLIKYFEKVAKEQRDEIENTAKALSRANKVDYDEFVKLSDAKVQKEQDSLNISLMQNNDSLNQHLALLDAEKEAAILKAIEKQESIKSIEDFYNEKKLKTAREYRYKEQMETMQYVESVGRIFSELSNFTSALGERELQDYDKTIQGKINHDELYGKKKAEIETRNAILQRSVASFGVIVNTAGAIMKLAEQLGVAALPLQIAEGILGAAQLATIWAAPLPSYNSSGGGGSSQKVTKKTVKEKFHTGGTNNAQTGVETPATLLGGESVNTIATTQMFSPLLSALNQLGGGKAITSGVANTGLGTDMLASAFSKALRNMPAPILIMEEFEKASEKHKKIQNNRIIR